MTLSFCKKKMIFEPGREGKTNSNIEGNLLSTKVILKDCNK